MPNGMKLRFATGSKTLRILSCVFSVLFLFTIGSHGASGGEFWNSEAPLGSWLRRILPGSIQFEAAYTGEVFSNLSGGLRRETEYLDNLDVMFTFDVEQLFGWNGATFFFYGLGNNGGDPGPDNVGAAQGVSNIEAFDTWKLYEAWFEQNLFDDRFALRFGLYDVNSDFDVIETAGLFLNPSHGIGPDYSQSGKNGPSIFPTTSLGARVKVQARDSLYIQAAVLDGVPGDPNNSHGTHIILGREDGLLVATEVTYQMESQNPGDEPYSKLAFGSWFYTKSFDDVQEVDNFEDPVQRTGDHGFYVLAERTLYREVDDPAQGLAVFARFGVADTWINSFGSYTGFGWVYTGLIPGRHKDQVGLALAHGRHGDRFQKGQAEVGIDVDVHETILEFSYRVQLTPWLAVQPDVQLIVNPGSDPSVKDAFVLGTRFEVVF